MHGSHDKAGIKQAGKLRQKGDTAKALELLEAAWKMTQQHDFLKYLQSSVLREQGRTHLQRQTFKESVEAFQKRLHLAADDCRNKADAIPYASECAEAHMELGTAQPMLGETFAALGHLREAADIFQMCTKPGPETAELARLGYRRLQAEALAMAGLATARMGETAEAKTLLNKAITILEGVEKHRETNEALRLSAGQLLEFARQQLSAFR